MMEWGLTLFTQSNLAELGSPVAPNPVSNASRSSNRYDNRKEDRDPRCAVFLVEIAFMAWTRVCNAFIHFPASLTGRNRDASVASRSEPFVFILVGGAGQRVIWWRVALGEGAGAIGLSFIIEVTVLLLARNHEIEKVNNDHSKSRLEQEQFFAMSWSQGIILPL